MLRQYTSFIAHSASIPPLALIIINLCMHNFHHFLFKEKLYQPNKEKLGPLKIKLNEHVDYCFYNNRTKSRARHKMKYNFKR